jgi:hypothetical protein
MNCLSFKLFSRVQVTLACLCLCVAPWSSACGYQQRAKTVTAKQAAKTFEESSKSAWGAEAVHLVEFPTPELEFIIGPQLRSGSPLNPFPWFDQNARTKGTELGEAFPVSAPTGNLLRGNVKVERGSKVVIGTGTRFKTEFPGAANNYYVLITDMKGIKRSYYLASIQDDTHLTLTAPWQEDSGAGLAVSSLTGDVADAYVNLNYYDLAFCQYINYYRTGDERYLTYARKIADSWWQASFIADGTFPIDGSLAPRNISLGGLMLRALDGRPEMWPWITNYTRTMFDIWVGTRVTYPGLYFGARDPGYMLLHAANLARVHPDQSVRAEFKTKVQNAAVNYYARVQRPDGSWRWGAEGSWIGEAMQPFHVGLLLEGMIAVHRLTGDERVKASIIKGAEAIYQLGYNPRSWRATYYQVGGKWADGTDCERGCGAAAGSYPPADRGQVAEARQLSTTSIHALGYAYLLSKDAKFKKWGDEMFDATYSGGDGYRSLANFRAKEYSEANRSAGRYLAWRLAWGASASSQASQVPVNTAPPKVETPSSIASSVTAGPTTAQDFISDALQEAMRLSNSGALSDSLLLGLLEKIDSASKIISSDRDSFLNANAVLEELKAAREHANFAMQMLKSQQGASEQSQLRVSWAAARLKRAVDRMQAVIR